MRYLTTLLVGFTLLTTTAASAQDFGVAQSAETINVGNIKLLANPMFVFGKDGSNDEGGLALGVGYGLTDRVDVEGRIALFEDVNFYGGDIEFGLVPGSPYNISATIGGHFTDTDVDNWGALDLTLQASRHATPKLEIYGAFDFTAEFPPDNSYKTLHLVPGIEYAVSDDLDLVAEFGIGLTDDSYHYVTGGVAYYFR